MPRQQMEIDPDFIDFTIYKPTKVWVKYIPQKAINLCVCPFCGKTAQKVDSHPDLQIYDHQLKSFVSGKGTLIYEPILRCINHKGKKL